MNETLDTIKWLLGANFAFLSLCCHVLISMNGKLSDLRVDRAELVARVKTLEGHHTR
jgi:hypothetical protein